jgi:hypothetical protein
MKKIILLLGLVLVTLVPAQAQVFRPAGFRGYGSWHGGRRDFGYRDGWWGVGFYAPVVLGSYGYVYRDVPVTYADYGYYDAGYYAAPSYQASGTWLGALAGAIIGRNSGSLGHSAWRGAAYGAGLGFLLGTVADTNVRARATAQVRQSAAPVSTPAASSAQPVTIINNYYNTPATPMSSANGLFGRN